ncbi:MAG: tetraacyldisaccharide 4'-kinase [Acidobacteria bacterium]|nr:tetraacyldisaccharide 4'-kinase [Acidobacteriota bacterium]
MSTAFRFILRAREKLYETGILTALRLNHPVVSIGNLTLGGTGKTPLVIALAEGLRDRGYHPVILSRGYKRTSRQILVVGNSWEEAGDEPYLIKRRLRDVPVVVGADRFEAGRYAERKQLGNLFILDDGFQHRRLHRDVDIVTIDPLEWDAGESLLPAGRWREPKDAIVRAHAACVQDVPGVPVPQLPIPSFNIQTKIDGIYKDDAQIPPESLRNRAVVAFAGIAKPERFFSSLESIGIAPRDRVRFRDHHRYTRRDIERLGGEILITTEKDAARLEGLGGFLYLRISVNIPEFDRLLECIQERFSSADRTG